MKEKFCAAGSTWSLVLSAFYRNVHLGQSAAETSWFGKQERDLTVCQPSFL